MRQTGEGFGGGGADIPLRIAGGDQEKRRDLRARLPRRRIDHVQSGRHIGPVSIRVGVKAGLDLVQCQDRLRSDRLWFTRDRMIAVNAIEGAVCANEDSVAAHGRRSEDRLSEIVFG